jgi:hypothetical protein
MGRARESAGQRLPVRDEEIGGRMMEFQVHDRHPGVEGEY